MRKQSFLKAIAGFTLIELIAVIAIMTIAATIAVPMIIKSNEKKREDIYKEACAYVLDSANAIAESFSKGANTIDGVDVSTTLGVQNLIRKNNDMTYKFEIIVTNYSDVPTSVSSSKDYVVVYFKYNSTKTEAHAVGAWYVLKGADKPAIKYDFVKGISLPYDKQSGKFEDFTDRKFKNS